MSATTITTSLDEIEKLSKENDKKMYVVLVADPSEDNGKALKQYFEQSIIRPDDVIVYLTVDKSDVFPHVKFFVDGEEMQGKTYFGTNPDDDNEDDEEPITDLGQAKNDISLFIMANVYAHKNPPPDFLLGGDDDEEDEEEEEEAVEDEEDNDEEQNEEDEEEMDEDEDDVDDEEYEDEEMAENSNAIKQEEILEIWNDIVPILNNELHFTTYRNALADNVKSVFFQGNSLMAMMSNVADLPPPEQEDLEEVMLEGGQLETLEDLSSYAQEFAKIKPTDSEAYQIQDDEDLNEEDYAGIEWRSFGTDLLRIQIGRWSSARAYNGQYRIKVVDGELIYDFFQFTAPPLKPLPANAEELKTYMLGQVEEFKKSKQYRMKVKLPVNKYHFHSSQVDPTIGLLIVEVSETPLFQVKKINETTWTNCTDFTTGQQATAVCRHVVLANNESLQYIASQCAVNAERIKDLDAVTKPLIGQVRTGVEEKDAFLAQAQTEQQKQQQEGCCVQ